MSVEFPKLIGSGVYHIGICAVFPSRSKGLAKIVAKGEPTVIEAKYGARNKECFIQAIVSRFPRGQFHLHVNIATPEYFDGDVPEDLAKIEEVTSLIDPFIGKRAQHVMIRARYEFGKDELPEGGLALGLDGMTATIAEESLTLVGSRFLISGSPYDMLEVDSHPDEDDLSGRMCASFNNAVLDADYLVAALHTIERGIDIFLLEEEDA